MNKKQLLMGYDVAVQACVDAGATQMYGYPITPTSEVLAQWIRRSEQDENLQHLQTEDEIAAGFAVCGAVMAGDKAFTATAGPGTVLMQDAMSMAEGMRLPFVAIIGQRGGPSSGTVIYSQQEVNLAIHGGNGEGLRVVYSPATLEELYTVTRQAFNTAWKYKFPTSVLTDGFLLKTKQDVELEYDGENVEAEALVDEHSQKNIRNIYTIEEELMSKLEEDKRDFDAMRNDVEMSEVYMGEGGSVQGEVDELIIAHGIVGAAAKEAVDKLRVEGKNIGLFRPITLSPFPIDELNELAKKVKKIWFVESSMGQLRDLVKQQLDPTTSVEMGGLYKPAVGIEVEEISRLFN